MPLVIAVMLLMLVAPAVASPAVTFLQQPTTEKRGGTLPNLDQPPPAVIGVPKPGAPRPAPRMSGDSREEALRQLQERRRGRGGAAGTAVPESSLPAETLDSPLPGEFPDVKLSSEKPVPTVSHRGSNQPGIKLNFRNAPIDTVINAIMQELSYSYVIDPQVTGTVNIFTMGEIPRRDLFGVLEQLLKMNGQAVVKQEDLYIFLPIGQSPKVPHQILVKPRPVRAPPAEPEPDSESSSQESKPAPPPAPSGSGGGAAPVSFQQEGIEGPIPQPVDPESMPTVITVAQSSEAQQIEGKQGVITYIIPLHYIPSSEMIQMVQPFISDGATVIDYQSANILIITDYTQNIQQVLNLVSLLDTQYFDINTIDLVPIRYNKAKDVAEDLGQVFAPGDKAGGVRLVAIERLNSILVVTHSPAVFQEVRNWIAKLDVTATSSNLKTFVYQVENNTAMNIAEILGQLYQDGFGLPSTGLAGPDAEGQNGTTAATRTPYREPGFTSRYDGGLDQYGGGAYGGQGGYGGAGGYGGGRGGGRGGGGRGGALGGSMGPSLMGRPNASQSVIRAVVAGNVKIVVNEFNNSLIIQATEADYQFLMDTIRQLDILPRQVLIEARIYSVELRDELKFGVSAFLQKRGTVPSDGEDEENGAGTVGPNQPATTGQLSASGIFSLTTRAFIGNERELQAIINALRSKTNVEIVEAPRLLAMDGMQAQINIGAEVPVTNASFGDPLRSGTTNFINSISFRPTGTTLLIVPRISASGIVTMDLAVEVSSATGTGLTPTINRNYVETSLLVRDGQTVAIAGLISDHFNLGRDRIPVLGDIPILGVLFGQSTRNERRQELIFFITPRVIYNLPTSTELTLNFKRALRNAYEFIEESESGERDLIQERREEELRRELENSETEPPQ